MTKQCMLIMPGKGRRLPKARELKAAGFLVSSAVGKSAERKGRGSGETENREGGQGGEKGEQ